MERRVTRDVLHASVQGSSMVIDFGKEFIFRDREAIGGTKVGSKTLTLEKQILVDLRDYSLSLRRANALVCVHARGPNLWIRQVRVMHPQLYIKQAQSEIEQVGYTYEDASMCVEGVECGSITLQLHRRGEYLEIQACLE